MRALWTIKHELFYLSRFVGLRDRLRCPSCGKIGTRKPHKKPRRWLCKWCGSYNDHEKRYGWCSPCKKKKVWMLVPKKRAKTPLERCNRVDPWKG